MSKRFRLAIVNSHPIQYFAPLYRRIAESPDIDITVYYCSRQGLDKGFIDPGFGKEVVWDVPLLNGYRHKFLANIGGDRGVHGFFSLINPSIITELWQEKYDAVLIHGHNVATNLLALVAAKLFGTRVFMRGETHLLLKRHPLKRALRRPIMALLYRLCDACLYIGTRNREFYQVHGVPVQKLFFVPYTVDNEAFAARAKEASSGRNTLCASLGLPPGMPVILYASKLIPRKRPRDLLLAYAELGRRGIRAALVFVGDGAERSSLEQEVASLGLTHVVFVGFVNQSELPRYYSAADIFVLPSEDEPWGLIINEVMCAGLPTITTTDVGAAPDLVVHGETGYVYRAGDIDALSRFLEVLLGNPERARQMGERARKLIANWNYDKCVNGIRAALANARTE